MDFSLPSLMSSWTSIAPYVEPITEIGGLIALVIGAWHYLRKKIIPITVFGYHTGYINTLLRDFEIVAEADKDLRDKPGRIAAYAGFAVCHLMTLLVGMMWLGFIVSHDITMLASFTFMSMAWFYIRVSRYHLVLWFLSNPEDYLRRYVQKVSRKIDVARATGIKSDRLTNLRTKVDEIEKRIKDHDTAFASM